VKLKIKLTPSERTIRGIGGIRRVNFLNGATLKLKGLQVDSLNFHVNDYDILSSVYGIKIDGIIGYSFLSRYIVKLDYDSSRMFVYTKGEFRYPKGGHILRPQFGTIPIQTMKFRDEPKRPLVNKFYFDTGAGLWQKDWEGRCRWSSLPLKRYSSALTNSGMCPHLYLKTNSM
jgi:hypothetical protein